MGEEIERRFLIEGDVRLPADDVTEIRQGYLLAEADRAVRVRVAASEAWLTIKKRASARRRLEFEYAIPIEDAEALLQQAIVGEIVHKSRYRLHHGDHLWEIDRFDGANAGLLLAEIELASEDEAFARPGWLGAEVTDDPRYTNGALARRPFRDWSDEGDG